MEQKTNYNEMLRHENELTRLKIKAEFGVDIKETDNMNPAVENIWLNNILKFERAVMKNEKVTIAELLGNPVFKKVNEIPDKNISEELIRLMDILKSKNVVINSVAGVEDREMYRFISEELVKEETESNMPENMILCFIYEEFYPNHKYDICKQAKEFINDLEKKESKSMDHYLASESDDIKEVEMENLRRRINLFRDAFDEIRVEEFQIKDVSVENDDTTAELIFEFKIATLPPGNKKYHFLSGTGAMGLVNQYGWWGIDRIKMQGVV